jgi:methyl-accepting chemotaxis protein
MLEKFKGIKGKLFAAFFLVALVPVIGLGFLGIREIKGIIREDFVKSTTEEIKQVDNAINLYFEEIKKNNKMLANHAQVQKADKTITNYMDKTNIEEMTPLENGGLEAEIFSYYQEYITGHPNTNYVYLATTEGGYIQWPAGGLMDNYDPRERPFYKKAMENKGEVVRTEPYYFPADDVITISTVSTVKNEAGDIIGVQGLDVGLDNLTSLVEDISIGDSGYVIMTDKEGNILAHPKNSDLLFEDASRLGVEELKNIDELEADVISGKLNGKDYLLNVYTSPTTGWNFIAMVEEKELAGQINNAYKIIGGIIIISLLLVGFLARFLINRFTTPLLTTIGFTNKIADGDLNNEPLEIDRDDELGQLANSLNRMQSNLQEMVTSVVGVVEELTAYSQELSASSEEGKAVVDSTGELVESIAGSIQEISASAQEVSSFAQDSTTKTNQGQENIVETLASINQIGESVSKAVDKMEELDKISNEIGEAANLITDIAEQTNLLALNAAIEAARAKSSQEGSGQSANQQAGHGFEVVAEEIRELSSETNEATDEIEDLIEETRAKIDASQQVISEVEDRVEKGEETAKTTKEIFTGIKKASDNTSEKIEQTAKAAQSLTSDSEEVEEATNDIRSMSAEITTSAQELTEMAQRLQEVIEQFDVK